MNLGVERLQRKQTHRPECCRVVRIATQALSAENACFQRIFHIDIVNLALVRSMSCCQIMGASLDIADLV
jgi:hypothetical protein